MSVTDDATCILVIGADDLDWLAIRVARLGFPTQILDPAKLRVAATQLADTLRTMSRP